MPTKKTPTPVSSRKRIQTPEIIFLALPIVALVVILLIVSLNGNSASGKPSSTTPLATVQAASSATATPVATTVTSTTSAPTTSAPTTITSSITATTIASTTETTGTPSASITTTAARAIQTVKAGEPEGRGSRLTKTESGITFSLLVSPGHIGDNTFTVLLSENDNQAVTNASLVRVSVNSLDMQMGVANLDLKSAGSDNPGLYSASDTELQMLSMVGKFNLVVLVQRPGKSDVSATFELNVANS